MLNRRNFLGSAGAVPLAAIHALDGVEQAGAAEAPASAPLATPAFKDSYEVKPDINSDLKAHGTIFERRIHKVGENVYSAVGWSGCNTIMLVGPDGVVIVDTGAEVQSAREVAVELRKISDKPVRAVVYTCFHLDHISGVKGFVSDADVKSGRVAVIAHETFLSNVIRQGRKIAPVLGARTAYNFGVILEGTDIEAMNNGTGPLARKGGKASFIAPTLTFAQTLDITIAGIPMHLVHVPSEAADEVAVFLPESGILLSSEVIPAQHFPALHPLRGEAYRDPVAWYRSIDVLRRFKPVAIVPSHGVPVIGADAVEEVLRNYRDAIQFVHDQTIRQMNKALTPDELRIAELAKRHRLEPARRHVVAIDANEPGRQLRRPLRVAILESLGGNCQHTVSPAHRVGLAPRPFRPRQGRERHGVALEPPEISLIDGAYRLAHGAEEFLHPGLVASEMRRERDGF
jgi:glyoxylase-like metal-dependent hydrolase (beta-lactamase superfamily II)